MSRNYNVDDILEEIRSKKAPKQEDAPARGAATYSGETTRPPVPRTEAPPRYAETPPPAARASAQRPAVSGFGEDGALTEGRRARPSAFPIRARQQPQEERPTRQQYAEPERPTRQQYAEPERPTRQQYAEPERPTHQQYAEPERPTRQQYAEPERPTRQQYAEPERPTRQQYAEPERPTRQQYAEPERPMRQQYAEPERPTRQQYAEPERPTRQQYAEPEPPQSAPRSRFEFINADEFRKKPADARQFDFETAPLEELPVSPPAPRRETRGTQFDFDSAPVTRPPRGETLADTLNRVRRAEPAPQANDGYDDPDGGYPAWADEEPRIENFVDPMDIPLPDGTRVDIPIARGFAGDERDYDAPAPRPTKRAAERRPRGDNSPESIVRSQWQQGYAAQDQLEQDEPADDDFASPEDAPFVAKDIKSIRTGLNVRLGLTLTLGVLSLYLAMSMRVLSFAELIGLGEDFLLPLPAAILPEKNMRLFVLVNLIICVLAAIVCSNIIGGGIAALFRMRADGDSPAALALIGALAQGLTLAISPVEMTDAERYPYISLYFCVAIAALLFNLLGKKILINRVDRNFKSIAGEEEKRAFVQIKNRDFAREFCKGLGPDVDRVAYTARTGFLTGFLDKSYSPDYSNSFSRIVVPIVSLGALAVAVITYVLSKDAAIAVSAFAAVLCVTAPFSSVIMPQMMMGSVSKRLTRKGTMLAGYEPAEDFAETGAVIINDRDLFADDCVMLHGMKVFAEKRIDEAILDAASVILSCDGIMSGVFLNMLGGNRRLLKKVDSLIYEDSMGLSAWVDGKRVLIGSRELMDTHSIDCPSRDFESRYTRDGRQVLYIANSGELSAMFVVSYNAAPETADTLAELERRGCSTIVYSTDPNVTSELIAAAFGVKRGHVKVLPAKLHPEYAFLAKPKDRVSGGGAYSGGLRGILRLLRAASAVKHSVTRGTVVQLIGVIVGYTLVAITAFTGSLSSAAYSTLLLFNLAWLVVTVLAAALVKR